MENFIYFISETIIALGIILSIFLSFKMKDKNSFIGKKWSPKRHIAFLGTVFFLGFLGILVPFFGDFLKLSGLSTLNIFQNLGPSTINIPFEDYTKTLLNGALVISPFGILSKFLIVTSAFFVSLVSLPFIKVLNQRIASFSTLFLFVVLGGLFLTSANDVLSLFISAEAVSLTLCFLIANFSTNKEKYSIQGANPKNASDTRDFGAPLEASVKYFVLNAIASCFMLLAASYIYLHLGTLNFSDIETLPLNNLLAQSPLLNAAEVIFFSALMFKIGAFPFYIWVMDVFKGTNYATGLLISTTIQAIGVIALAKTALALGYFGSILNFALILCAVLTLVLGNLLAFRIVKKEGKIKDFLSANTIASIGYAILGISFLTKGSICAGIFSLIVYLTMTFGLWAGFGLILKNLKTSPDKDTKVVSSIRGLAYISPAFGTAFAICLLSFAGFPLMAGFSAKFYLFTEILRSGAWAVYPLLLCAFSSILCVYYCFKLVYFMFQKPKSLNGKLKIFKKNTVFKRTNVCTFILLTSAAVLFILFFMTGPIVTMLNNIL